MLHYPRGSHKHSHPSVNDTVSIVVFNLIASLMTYTKEYQNEEKAENTTIERVYQNLFILNKFWNRSIWNDQ